MYTVYVHTVPNGKRYVGITSQKPKKRWGYGYGYKNNEKFYKDICRYGWNNIVHEIVFTTDVKEEAESKEKEFIALYDTMNIEKGYNSASGGFKDVRYNERFCNRISEANKGNKNAVGYIQTEEHKKKVGETKKKKVLCVEKKDVYPSVMDAAESVGTNPKNISACLRGKCNTTCGFHWVYAE